LVCGKPVDKLAWSDSRPSPRRIELSQCKIEGAITQDRREIVVSNDYFISLWTGFLAAKEWQILGSKESMIWLDSCLQQFTWE